MGDDNGGCVIAFWWVISVVLCFFATAKHLDIDVDKYNLAQEICIKNNSRAVSFDRTEVTCENKAVIPLNGG